MPIQETTRDAEAGESPIVQTFESITNSHYTNGPQRPSNIIGVGNDFLHQLIERLSIFEKG